jgi:hypothetical protein
MGAPEVVMYPSCRRPARLAVPLLFLGVAACNEPPSQIRLASPSATEQSAQVDFHVEYRSRPGDKSLDRADYDGVEIGTGAHTIFARPAKVKVGTKFWHVESHWEERDETVTEYKTESETDWCARRDRRGDCQSGTRLVTKPHTKRVRSTYLVRVAVPDGACSKEGSFRFEAGKKHHVEYTFVSKDLCTLTCTTDDGSPCAEIAEAAVPPAVTDKYTPHPMHALGVGVTTVGVLGALAGAGVGIAALSKRGDVSDHCDANKVCDAQGLAAVSDGQRLATASSLMFAASTGVFIGGLLIMRMPGRWDRTPVTVGADGRGLVTVSGAFQ